MSGQAVDPAAKQSLCVKTCMKTMGVLKKANVCFQPALLLGIRLLWGSAFFLSGLGKLKNIDRTTEFFTSLEVPLPHEHAILVGLVECVGGALLAIGLGSRLAAVALAGAMLGAIHFAHDIALFTQVTKDTSVLFGDPGAVIGETPVSYLVASLVVLAFGPGVVSLDALIARFCCRKAGACELPK